VSVEALIFAVLAVLELLNVSSERVGLGVGVTLFLVVIAGGLLFAAWRIAHGDAWARSPLVFAQLLQLGLAWNFRGDASWVAPTIAVPAVVVLACLLAPPVTRHLTEERPV
jgi:hypothetical protein